MIGRFRVIMSTVKKLVFGLRLTTNGDGYYNKI